MLLATAILALVSLANDELIFGTYFVTRNFLTRIFFNKKFDNMTFLTRILYMKTKTT